MQKVGILQILGIVAFFGFALAVHLWTSGPSVSGSLRIDGVELGAERCSGFAGGVQIYLEGEGYHSVTGARTPWPSGRLLRHAGRPGSVDVRRYRWSAFRRPVSSLRCMPAAPNDRPCDGSLSVSCGACWRSPSWPTSPVHDESRQPRLRFARPPGRRPPPPRRRAPSRSPCLCGARSSSSSRSVSIRPSPCPTLRPRRRIPRPPLSP